VEVGVVPPNSIEHSMPAGLLVAGQAKLIGATYPVRIGEQI